ncbi:hypothetical protein CIRG_09881 [Coccidioides immitis RMSCC 2394]|uniref:Uncharacterized protein n=1 Tax=Coccidioides immitis RMSCC 2394 TaxID=404692 RepID=A0A0J6YQX9_COCIT|nr:hypothetical protein CIRG_09881 [Coccidioides immitis RMSCC 2394]
MNRPLRIKLVEILETDANSELELAFQKEKDMSVACTEDAQLEETVIQIASNGSVSPDILSWAQLIVNDLNSITCGDGYFTSSDIHDDLHGYQNMILCPRSEVQQ